LLLDAVLVGNIDEVLELVYLIFVATANGVKEEVTLLTEVSFRDDHAGVFIYLLYQIGVQVDL
jgi:hypothetical protein